MIWFTSDTHFGHKAMVDGDIGQGWRSDHFSSLEEMDEVMIENWNERVHPGDMVYHLGDLSFHGPEETAIILSRLNGQIFLVKGNHDHKSITKSSLVQQELVWIKDYKRINPKINPAGLKQAIALCHFPMVTWHGSSNGSWMLHGHCHGNLSLPHPMDIAPRLDVGVDCWNFAPVSLQEVADVMSKRTYVPIDHHGTKEDYRDGS